MGLLLGLFAIALGQRAAGAQDVAAPPSATIPTVQAAIEARPAFSSRGLTISAGLGFEYGFLGVQARYDLPLREWLHVAPFAAPGMAHDYGNTWLVGSLGVAGSVGVKHRLALDLAVAPVAWEPLSLHGTVVDVRTLYGPHVGAGYEVVTAKGFLFRSMIGYGWGQWSTGVGTSFSGVNISLGIGRRVW
jgi:hypothetical protein